jgi:hypothetical protein
MRVVISVPGGSSVMPRALEAVEVEAEVELLVEVAVEADFLAGGVFSQEEDKEDVCVSLRVGVV